MKKPVTISRIAKEAGVSVSTVSRVLNNKPDVLDETREREIGRASCRERVFGLV